MLMFIYKNALFKKVGNNCTNRIGLGQDPILKATICYNKIIP